MSAQELSCAQYVHRHKKQKQKTQKVVSNLPVIKLQSCKEQSVTNNYQPFSVSPTMSTFTGKYIVWESMLFKITGTFQLHDQHTTSSKYVMCCDNTCY